MKNPVHGLFSFVAVIFAIVSAAAAQGILMPSIIAEPLEARVNVFAQKNAFSSDSSHIATADSENTIRIWSLSGRQEKIFLWEIDSPLKNLERIRLLRFSENDKFLTAITWSGALSKWRAGESE